MQFFIFANNFERTSSLGSHFLELQDQRFIIIFHPRDLLSESLSLWTQRKSVSSTYTCFSHILQTLKLSVWQRRNLKLESQGRRSHLIGWLENPGPLIGWVQVGGGSRLFYLWKSPKRSYAVFQIYPRLACWYDKKFYKKVPQVWSFRLSSR